MTITINKNLSNSEPSFEVIEKKCEGHPDTLADRLAEYLSSQYSKYTLEKYKAVLHHNFDKVGLLGGATYVTLGKGYITKPITVLINGRVSISFGEEKIPYRTLLTRWTKEFFQKVLPMISVDEDLDIHLNLSHQSSPGKVYEDTKKQNSRKYWFEPRGLEDLGELKKLVSNDTSLGVGYAPLTRTEQLVSDLENVFLKEKYELKWLGTDIKIMAFRESNSLHLTVCVPQIANYVQNIEAYKKNLRKAKDLIESVIRLHGFKDYEVTLNNRDNYETREIYLTATGSSIESGDEGLVGRGNRVNGLITPRRPMSMEGASGKNPVYHIGKLYYVGAFKLAQHIYKETKVPCEVYLISQTGRELIDPWQTIINVPINTTDLQAEKINKVVKEWLPTFPNLTTQFINHKLLTA